MDAETGITEGQSEQTKTERHRFTHLSLMYENWFLNYASYVILERAVPDLLDGLKPVQRRILYAMREIEDGRYNKVANIIGQTMKYHPHGDISIGDALVQMGQKNLLIDTQGNWGNIYTADPAAAFRYIEARLSKFALEVVFNPKTTKWKQSYDGRNKEPVLLPVKFPLLLYMGAEGIAVGLASKILPHNFNELIDASIKILKNQDFEIFPDFPTGGLIDVTKYNSSEKEGKIRIRAKITKTDSKTLVISEIPFSTNTNCLIESIISASEKGKIKIKKIDDNTSENVEIVVHLSPGVNSDQTIDALYAFTLCEISINPNLCVIHNGKPFFTDVNNILRISTLNTVELLTRELEIQKHELQEQHLFATLEKIFIEKRIYRKIEECETWEEVIKTITDGLKPYTAKFYRTLERDDIIRLTEIKIKRISKFDILKAGEIILSLEDDMKDVQNNLDNLIEYTINYFQNIKQKYGKSRERKSKIRSFDQIEATAVAAANVKLYVNRQEGFAGYGLKKDEFVTDCSDIDEIIAFKSNGSYIVTKISDKVFIGKNIIHIDVFKRNDENTIYNVIYQDVKNKFYYVKRFAVTGIIRDKEYNLCGNSDGTIVFFSANQHGETETVTVFLKPKPRLKNKEFDFDFAQVAVKGRNSKGNILLRKPIRKVTVKIEAKPVLKAVAVWYDAETRRLNTENRGTFLGDFLGNDKIITFYDNGNFCIHTFNIHTHFADNLLLLRKFNPNHTFSAIYYNNKAKSYYIKRFLPKGTPDRIYNIVDTGKGNELYKLIEYRNAEITIFFKKEKDKKEKSPQIYNLSDFVSVKNFKAKGKYFTKYNIRELKIKEIEHEHSENIIPKKSENTADIQKLTVESVTDVNDCSGTDIIKKENTEIKKTPQQMTLFDNNY